MTEMMTAARLPSAFPFPDDPRIWRAPMAFLLSGLLATLLLPVAATLAVRLGAVDQPGGRRLHHAPIPRLGGVAVIFATLGACALGALGASIVGAPLDLLQAPYTRAMVVGALVIFGLGMADDLRGVSPRMKLVVQTVAALIVVRAGIVVDSVMFARDLPVLNAPFIAPLVSVLWIVGMTNAFNLIDGLDGLATVCAIVALATLVVSGIVLEQASSFVFVSALLGAMLAFVRKNWHPASIFLGDAGSMTIGFLLAVRAIPAATDHTGSVYSLVPLAAFCYPLLDTSVSIARRWLRGHSFSRADGRHIHHQLVAIGMSVPRAVRVIAVLSVVLASAALLVSFAPPHMTVALAVLACLLISVTALYGALRLEYSEFIAFGKAAYSAMRQGRRIVRERIRIADLCRRVKMAPDEATILLLVADLVNGEHVRRAELVDPVSMARQPRVPSETGNDYGAMVRFECPVRRDEGVTPLQLRVWVTPEGITHHTLQRIERMFCPELEFWYQRAAGASSASATVPLEAPPPSVLLASGDVSVDLSA